MSRTLNITVSVENATAFINGIELINGFNSQVEIGEAPYLFEIVSNEGYWFYNFELNASLSYRNKYNSVVYIARDVTIENPSYEDNWSDDYTKFTYSFDISSSTVMNSITISGFSAVEGGLEPERPSYIDLVTGVYNVDELALQKLSNERYTSAHENVPIGNYIHAIYEFPFSLEAIKGELEAVVLGGATLTEVEGIALTESTFEIPIAEIDIPSKYNNAYDYINTECYLFLPYINPIEIDPARVINQTLYVECVANMFEGEGVYNVYSNNNLLTSQKVKLGYELPFYQRSAVSSETPEIKTPLFNDVAIPFIEVVRNIPYNEGIGSVISEYAQLNNYTGYVEVEKVEIEGSATKSEKELIQNILMKGVYIK